MNVSFVGIDKCKMYDRNDAGERVVRVCDIPDDDDDMSDTPLDSLKVTVGNTLSLPSPPPPVSVLPRREKRKAERNPFIDDDAEVSGSCSSGDEYGEYDDRGDCDSFIEDNDDEPNEGGDEIYDHLLYANVDEMECSDDDGTRHPHEGKDTIWLDIPDKLNPGETIETQFYVAYELVVKFDSSPDVFRDVNKIYRDAIAKNQASIKKKTLQADLVYLKEIHQRSTLVSNYRLVTQFLVPTDIANTTWFLHKQNTCTMLTEGKLLPSSRYFGMSTMKSEARSKCFKDPLYEFDVKKAVVTVFIGYARFCEATLPDMLETITVSKRKEIIDTAFGMRESSRIDEYSCVIFKKIDTEPLENVFRDDFATTVLDELSHSKDPDAASVGERPEDIKACIRSAIYGGKLYGIKSFIAIRGVMKRIVGCM